ncbi:hypothetical protein UA08_03778 [Talaromyces atroroseus]|uniref:Uncharacterized protein n=1 Tax=Talaromyces atroroseus TaxID=1441469 RepID=A0A225B092_TALAT|nr:hypothetical protein UA08_03778 [Talaromyces atroroseus]OKL61379.1 hypothetical protein UA08_03778 [Talaromyces atroroseus]
MMNTASPHSRTHRLSPSFTDSAIDVELSDSTQSDEDSIPIFPAAQFSLAERLSYITHLASENSLRGYTVDERAAINKCLGDLETLLLDPRPGISRVIALNRPPSPSSAGPPSRSATPTPIPTTTPTANSVTTRRKEAEDVVSRERNQTITEQTSAGLQSVLGALSSVNEELQQRYLESRHIHDLFIVKCEGLAQRIIELENEVHELKSDILEDTIELEGLRGTIRGLESWVNRWQRQREITIASSNPPSRRRQRGSSSSSSWRWKKKKQSTNHGHEQDVAEEEEEDFDVFLDGVLAWMRGWNDVEEGFLVRARRRKMRRDQKSSIT